MGSAGDRWEPRFGMVVVVVEDENGQISGCVTGCAEDRETLDGRLEDQSSV